jgi:ectoine hydroxylase-related dioxygenase (phytanoyl-CoA dioxygenase family)
MLTLRIHLDNASRENGCLRVIPKSHQRGIYTQQEIDQIKTKEHAILCDAKAGDCLMMRPHLLHASSKAIKPSRRRVLHLEFSVAELPVGLAWADS